MVLHFQYFLKVSSGANQRVTIGDKTSEQLKYGRTTRVPARASEDEHPWSFNMSELAGRIERRAAALRVLLLVLGSFPLIVRFRCLLSFQTTKKGKVHYHYRQYAQTRRWLARLQNKVPRCQTWRCELVRISTVIFAMSSNNISHATTVIVFLLLTFRLYICCNYFHCVDAMRSTGF